MQAEVFVDRLNQCILFTEEVRAPKNVGGPPRKAKVLDEKLTRQQVSALLDFLILAEGEGGVRDRLDETTDILCLSWPDRAGQLKGQQLRLPAIPERYFFCWALNYAYDYWRTRFPTERRTGRQAAIGVLSPGRGDRGKNIIRLCWLRAGYEVMDIGTNLKPAEIIERCAGGNVQALGIACVVSEAREMLENMFAAHADSLRNCPVIIGGIAVDRSVARDLRQTWQSPVYYCLDLHEAVPVLRQAIDRVEPPSIPADDSLAAMSISQIDELNFRMFELPIDAVAVDDQARAGCRYCSGEKNAACPLQNGWERHRTLTESQEFVRSFDRALLVATDIIDEADQEAVRDLWLNQFKLERSLQRQDQVREIWAFRFPTSCPFCAPEPCAPQPYACRFPTYYRPVQEAFNINMTATLQNLRREPECKIYSLILLKLADTRTTFVFANGS